MTATDLRNIESGRGDWQHRSFDSHLPALAILYGVSLEWLLHGDAELTVLRRRIERLRRRFGLPRKADVA